jgi:hypothetical protein
VRTLALGEPLELRGPGVIALDGDREIRLEPGEVARLCVERTGPFVIDVERTLRLAAERGAFVDRGDWRDSYDATND